MDTPVDLYATREALPVIRFADASEETVARQLDQAFSQIGFCYFADIGVDEALVEGVFAASRRFHALPRAAKDAIAMNSFHRGYMAPKTSLIETSTVAQVTRPNDSESFMLMHEVPPDDPRYGRPLDGPNLWPELPTAEFRQPVEAYEQAMEAFCRRRLLPAMALALGLPRDWFAPHFRQPTTFLRLLHYPPQARDAPEDAFGSAPHTDYGFITILCQDQRGGLEVRRRDGTWLSAPPLPGTWVVNVADMLSRWTNGRWQSTPHRVKNLSGGDRYSCPYFFDMSMDSIVEVVPSCHGPGNPARFPPVRYGDYLIERLDRNYAYRKQATS
ncbi:Isopenicillin N synthase [Enhydrobacter aerosaccus]|uniref:2-oxoglutarate-dependent ethylene/succinate-forming enzyme n=1 Tax=Enhydrobacter aerosaccus TaxID=225324 RepID=A0A1T4RXG8_9HYPH|nr:2OG-Fe(II) oxygenase family protein [Enhydrobacter aerosaccus]SKA20556.1 Isopenicillin N synthase [Enhydrobacter aerosaccus]